MLAACTNLFGPDGPKTSVSLDLQRSMEPLPELRVWIDGQRIETLADVPGGGPAVVTIHGPRYGSVPVRVVLASTAGDTLATAEFMQEFRRGDLHWIAAEVGPRRPLGHCIGTLLVTPLRAQIADTLFVMHGGIPEGAVC